MERPGRHAFYNKIGTTPRFPLVAFLLPLVHFPLLFYYLLNSRGCRFQMHFP